MYVPMCWDNAHWVGLAIHVSMWVVEVFDSAPSLDRENKMHEVMAPVVDILPHIIQNLCEP